MTGRAEQPRENRPGTRDRCPIDSLEANVDPPDRTPDSYRRALDSCPYGCKSTYDCGGHRKWR
jgi:hypothetical protein